MAEVLLGRLRGASGFERLVVIKRMLPQFARDEEFRSMFIDEARIASRLSHPNIVHVHELLELEGELYLVMEYLEGETLSALLRKLQQNEKRLPHSVCIYVLSQVAAGLHHAHELRDPNGVLYEVVHRDVSPQNIFIGYDGSVRLIDFGIAKARDRSSQTASGTIKGKFSYMSPEQITMGHVDRRADIYACGALLHEMLTMRRLFSGNHVQLAHRAISDEAVPRLDTILPDFPGRLADVVEKALQRNPADRFATAKSLQRALAQAGAELPANSLLPEERLGAAMERFFGESQTHKKTLAQFSSAPPTKTSEGGLAVSGRERASRRISAAAPTTDAIATNADPAGRRTRMALISAALAAATIGVVAAVAWPPTKTPETVDRTNEPLPTGGDGASAIPTARALESESQAASQPEREENSRIELEISTRPAGAEIVLDGEPQGTSPLVLQHARSQTPIELEARANGFDTYRATIVPDVHQRLDWVLERRRRRARRSAPPQEPMKRPAESMSEFFRVN